MKGRAASPSRCLHRGLRPRWMCPQHVPRDGRTRWRRDIVQGLGGTKAEASTPVPSTPCTQGCPRPKARDLGPDWGGTTVRPRLAANGMGFHGWRSAVKPPTGTLSTLSSARTRGRRPSCFSPLVPGVAPQCACWAAAHVAPSGPRYEDRLADLLI